MKKNIKYIIITIIFGIIVGKYIFNQYDKEIKSTTNITDSYIYLLQYGVYKDKNNMLESTKNLKNYLYYNDDKGYHVIIGITKNKKNSKKIVDSYSLSANIYNKGVKVSSYEFIELLDQYDELLNQSNDKEIIINAQKQVLSKYEELVLHNENK